MDLKEFTKIAFGHYSQIGEWEISQKEIDEDFEEYWNDKDTQLLIKDLDFSDTIDCVNCGSSNTIREDIYRCKECNCFHDKSGAQL